MSGGHNAASDRFVVVGASLAGVHAVHAARGAGYGGHVVLVGAEAELPYDRRLLSRGALLQADRELLLRSAEFYRSHRVELRLGEPAVGLDTDARRVTLANGDGVDYDRLLIATGASPRRLRPAPPGVHVLRSRLDCAALRDQLLPGRRLVVVGAGFLGLEVAATAREIGVQVVVLEQADAPLAHVLGPDAGAWLADMHREHGIDLRCRTGVAGVHQADDGLRVRCFTGEEVPADLVVTGIGVTPQTGWLRGSGVRVGDGVLCDEFCRTNVPGVGAAGDVARWFNPLFDEQMRLEHWTNAAAQGRRAALNLLREGAPIPYRPVPYYWSDQFTARIRFVGRAFAADEAAVVERDTAADGALVVLYRRDGLVRGALTINAPGAAARYRRLIARCTPWKEALEHEAR